MHRHPFRTAPIRAGLAVVVATGLSLSACGGGDKKEANGSANSSTTAAPNKVGGSVASYDLAVGPPSRFMLGMFNEGKGAIGYGTAQFTFFFLGADCSGSTTREPGPTATGKYIHLDGGTPHTGDTSKPVYLEEKGVYAADVGFDKPGFWGVVAVVDIDGPKETKSCFQVGPKHTVPAPGDAAIASQNLTMTTPGAAPEAIDSRASASTPVPDPELHQTTVAQALAEKRPVVLVISTPTYCVSQFCGPVTDTVADLAKTYADRARFIHIEVYKNYKATEIKDQLNDAAREWIAQGPNPTEPWVFVIDADGKVVARFDNIATRAEIEPLLQKLPKMKP